ncbi:MAG TPA: hypothetical protein VEU30_16050, partial [Thermoanaerobaculia bacterium]|nr:hypothetical protein [Thermoanaerobaculia bacterium]
MKRHVLAFTLLLIVTATAQAQWTEPDATSLATTDKVAIGSSIAPTKQLEVFGESAFSGNVSISRSFDGAVQLRVENSIAPGTVANSIFSTKSDLAEGQFKTHASGRTFVRFNVPVGGWTELAAISGHGLIVGTANDKPLILGTNSTRRMTITTTGNVGIGTDVPTAKLHVAGDVFVSGNIGAKYQDVAEWVPATSDLAAGTVVVLNPNAINEVTASSRAYDTTVAGVVSDQPGILLGEGAANKERIATTGRVRIRVDATAAAVAVGDLLVTSDRPGYAMKSLPVDVGGALMHRPGTIVGKALEPLHEGTGEILVLL